MTFCYDNSHCYGYPGYGRCHNDDMLLLAAMTANNQHYGNGPAPYYSNPDIPNPTSYPNYTTARTRGGAGFSNARYPRETEAQRRRPPRSPSPRSGIQQGRSPRQKKKGGKRSPNWQHRTRQKEAERKRKNRRRPNTR
ncbi:uncharacterized protein LOC142338397 isoform X1 [Convolutriloba macropyga]|uniref:uncharacterized protein LOC142338397 isoform X1 n=1 Tax=Convolutriloba macropyga TaxID=536237 RepID=UPI003F5200A7